MNISFELKEPRALADVQLVNRMNQAGEVGGNGFLSKVAAVMTFEDGSTQKFEGGEFDKKQGIYTFAPSKENAAKKVVKVDIKPLETPRCAHAHDFRDQLQLREGGRDRRRHRAR